MHDKIEETSKVNTILRTTEIQDIIDKINELERRVVDLEYEAQKTVKR